MTPGITNLPSNPTTQATTDPLNPFQGLKYLNSGMNWGDVTLMDPRLLALVDALVADMGGEIHVDCGVQGEHVADSQHGLGKACDVIFPACTLAPLDSILTVLRYPFGGVGYYPHWELAGVTRGGFHLDTRDGPRAAHWLGVAVGGVNQYLALSRETLSTYGCV